MAKTIIQTIGPLYGEVVNGTVFGRPNGSIFVPLTNKIVLNVPDTARYCIKQSEVYNSPHLCNEDGVRYYFNVVADSQDNQSYICLQLATDSEFTSVVAFRNINAGLFNETSTWIGNAETDVIVNGETYYFRAVLMASTNVPVAVSDTVELTGLVVS